LQSFDDFKKLKLFYENIQNSYFDSNCFFFFLGEKFEENINKEFDSSL